VWLMDNIERNLGILNYVWMFLGFGAVLLIAWGMSPYSPGDVVLWVGGVLAALAVLLFLIIPFLAPRYE
jgi:hypothetical protein